MPILIEFLEQRRLCVVAFPGAEGFGANSTGGRGGDVYHVTSLADTNTAGTLRYGINNTPASGRTIVFDVGGTIELLGNLDINKPKITIAGQTAPGDGITLAGRMVRIVNTNNIILRHVRIRVGDVVTQTIDNTYEPDSLWVAGSTDVMVDHVSTSWSIDETLSVTHSSSNVSVQWSFITESLKNAGHSKGAHGYGSLINGGSISYHHNLYAHHDSRNPRPGTANNLPLDFDFRNNVVYDWGGQAGYNGLDGDQALETNRLDMNYVGNYLIAGPSTSSSKVGNAFNGGMVRTYIYQSGNKIDSDRDHVRDGANTGWSMFSGSYTQQATPHAFANIPTTQTADGAYQSVLAYGGARSWNRDAVDTRIRNDVLNETGGIIDSQNQVGGWPTLTNGTPPTDTDQDGMPDSWESPRGLNPAVKDHNGDVDLNGYTNLEDYLNSLVPSIDSLAPAVASAAFVKDAMPMALRFVFSEAVGASFSNADLLLQNQTSGQSIPASSISSSYAAATNTGSYTFPVYQNGILPDGNYRATLQSGGVYDNSGNLLNSDSVFDFFVFAGDGNQDRRVDSSDFNLLSGNFGQSGRTFSEGNFNYAGSVDSADFNVLMAQYGKTLPAPALVVAARVSAGSLFGEVAVGETEDETLVTS